jgi:hypothetical protein
MFAAVTGLALSAAAGLNAYIPVLLVGLLARYTDVLTLPSNFSWLTNGWVLSGLAVLLAAEVVLDKIAIVDHLNDAVQTFIRPAAGGAAFAATSAASQIDYRVGSATFLHDNPWLGWVLGIGAALVVHLVKAGTRPVVNAGSVGTATPFVSMAEDAMSLGMSLLAIFMPIIALVALLILAYVALRLLRRIVLRRRARAAAKRPA